MRFDQLYEVEKEMVVKVVKQARKYIESETSWSRDFNAVNIRGEPVSMYVDEAVAFGPVGALLRSSVIDLRHGSEIAVHAIHILNRYANKSLHYINENEGREAILTLFDNFLASTI